MMKRVFSFIGLVLAFTFMLFFWASSGQWSEENYSKVVNYHPKRMAASDTLRLITYNIGYLSGMTNNQAVERADQLYIQNMLRAKALIDENQPDLLALQEIDFEANRSLGWNQFDSLAWSGQFYQGAYAVNWDKRYVPFPYWPPSAHFKSVVSGQGVLSKFPVVENQFIKMQQPNAPFYYRAFYLDRLIQVSLIKIDQKTLALLNVHLEAFDQYTRQQHGQHVLEVLKEYLKQYPVLLVGDFNANPVEAKSNVKKETVMDLFYQLPELKEAIPMQAFLANEKDFYTYSSEKPYQRIDYIFYSSKDIEAIEGRVLREAGQISDHLPVMFTFKWKN